MSILHRPKKPAPATLSGGIPIHLPEALTLAHPHARVAKTSFVAAYRYLPGGFRSYGATPVSVGSLADDRSPLVRDYPRRFRKPTKSERQPAPEPAIEEPASAEPPAATLAEVVTAPAAQAQGEHGG